MSNFRSSTLPEWAANENNGYFRGRSSMASKQVGHQAQAGSIFNQGSAPKKPEMSYLNKNPALAEQSLKRLRVLKALRDACTWQLLVFMVLFTVFSNETVDKESYSKKTWIGRIFSTFTAAIFSMPGFIFIGTLYLTTMMFSILLTSSERYSPSVQERIHQYTLPRFLFKPLIVLLFVNANCSYYLELFDRKYRNIVECKPISPDDDFEFESKPRECYFFEDNLVIRISICVTALHFFITNYINGHFSLKFPSVPVKSYRGCMFDSNVLGNSMKPSLHIALITGITCAVVGPLFYSTFFYSFGYRMFEDRFLERIFMFLNIWFMIRLFIYTLLTHCILPFLLILVNFHLTGLVNFPVEPPTGKADCLLLSEAMKGDVYLKSLAFYEYNYKADGGTFDLSVFFNITHPGNHPYNWKNLVSACYDVMTKMNEGFVSYLKANPLPSGFVDLGLGPTILNRLRERESISNKENVPTVPVEAPRNMRDLTSSTRPDFPNQIPTITEVVCQNLELLWNDAKAAFLGFFSMQTLNNLIFGGKLNSPLSENVIANLLSDHLITYWAIMGTLKLMCISVVVDRRGVVNQDINPFCVKLLELYDTLSAVDIYIAKSLDEQPTINRKILLKNKEIVYKLCNTCVFAIAKLHETYATSYNMLDMDQSMQNRILEIIS